MAVTRIHTNQIADGVVTNVKIANTTIEGGKLANSLTYGSDLTVSGNLIVNGTTTTVDTVNTTIDDPILLLGSNQTGSGAVDLGVLGERGDDTNVFIGYDESDDEFVAALTSSAESSTTVAITDYANMHVGGIEADDNATIGGTATVTGNITGANLLTAGDVEAVNVDASGTATVGTLTDGTATLTSGALSGATTGAFSGTVTAGAFNDGAATYDAGTITSGVAATFSGAVTGGSLTDGTATLTSGALSGATTLTASGAVTAGSLTTAGALNADGATTLGDLTIDGSSTVDMGANRVTNLATPTATGDAATKSYVDGLLSSGFTVSDSEDTPNTSTISQGDTLTFAGVANETTMIVGTDSLTVGLVDSPTVSGTITAGTLTDGTATITSGAIASVTTIGASGQITGGTLTDGTASMNSGALTGVTNATASGTVTGGTLTDGAFSVTSGAITGATTIAASSTITATGNITGGNILTSAHVGAATVTASGAINGATVTTTGAVTAGSLTTAGTLNADGATTLGDLTIDGTSTIDMGANRVTNVATPTASGDATTKGYVDGLLSSGFTITDGSTTQTVAQGDTVTFAGTANEVNVAVSATDTLTIGLPDDVVIGNDLTVTGDLVVQGTTTTVNSTTTQLVDPILQLGRGADNAALTSNDGKDRGISMYYYNTEERVAYMGWDDPTDEFRFIPDATITTEAVTGALGTANVGKVRVDNIDIDANLITATSGDLDLSAAGTGKVTLPTGNELVIDDMADTAILFSNSGEVTDNATDLSFDGTDLDAKNITTPGYVTATGTVTGSTLTDGTATITSGAIASVTTIGASGAVTAGSFTTAGALNADGATTLGDLTIDGSSTVDMGANRVTNVAAPTATTDATTKTYVDTAVSNASTFTITDGVTSDTVTIGTDTLTFADTANETTVTVSDNTVTVALPDDVTIGDALTVTGAATVGTTLGVTGATTVAAITASGLASLDGGIDVDGAFTVADTTGNIATTGKLDVTGAATVGSITDGTATISSGAVSGVTTLAMTSALTGATNITGSGTITGGTLTDGAFSVTSGAVTGVTTLATSGEATLASATVSDLTAGRVVYAGTDGALVDEAAFAYNASTDTLSAVNVTSTGTNTVGTLTDGTATLTGGALTGVTTATVDNITINGDDITTTGAALTLNDAGGDMDLRVESANNANMLVVDAGLDQVMIGTATSTTGATFKISATDSMMVPVGTTAQRPTGVAGMIRYNSTTDQYEAYDVSESQFKGLGVPAFTVIASQTFDGDGTTVAFTLSEAQTTASCIVSINGVVQLPTTAYAVSSTTLTFTEAPEASDKIEVRKITTTTTVTGLSNADASIVLETGATSIDAKGSVIPTVDATYDLGSASKKWAEVHAGTLTTSGAVTIGGDLTVSGTTTTVNSTTLDVADLNITIADGAADSAAADGAGLTVDGASATFTYSHSGTKWNMNKDLDLGSNNFITSGEFQGTATSAQYADLAEKYEADADYAPGTVVMFGGDKEVAECADDHSTKVAGVVSTAPAYRMNDGLEAEHTAMVALQGRVPCKVTGPVAKGDMMVSAGNGMARAEANPTYGAVIGKALENWEGGEGVIEVVIK